MTGRFADPPSLGQLEFDYIRALVHRESSIVLDDGKMYLVTSRLSPLAREHDFSSLAAFISHLSHLQRGTCTPLL